jgi:hypothetical protein
MDINMNSNKIIEEEKDLDNIFNWHIKKDTIMNKLIVTFDRK